MNKKIEHKPLSLINSILILERSSTLLKIINHAFNNILYRTFSSSNIIDAKDKITKFKIKYIILDINSSHNFLEFINELLKLSIKIVVIGSYIDARTKELLYEKGILCFIKKDKNFIHRIYSLKKVFKQLEKNTFKNILLINEKLDNKSELIDILISNNYNAKEIFSFNKVEEEINANKIDLILLNINNDKLNIYDFLVKNKKLIVDKNNIKIILISNESSSSQIKDFYYLGINGILKTENLNNEVIIKIEQLLNIKELEDENYSKQDLLIQYKNTVDKSSIVSKADAQGIITYVNDAFCKTSGYSKEELLGKPHNIVRHSETNSLVFKNMWKTIKEDKKPWSGKLKNRRKDGSPYWVKILINPILDLYSNVIEYICIRTDITHIEKTKHKIINKYNLIQNDFNESKNLSKCYEHAIDKSNIILRVNKDEIITYANDMFLKISGYSKEELFGQPYEFINKTSNMSKEESEKMYKCLRSKKTWTGQISNIFKSEKKYTFLVTIVPLTNIKGEIVEYISIRKDITELIDLHSEIEDTQREIIYKIGEIGETRSKETGNHVKRVAEYSKLLAQLYGLNNQECEILFVASPMHDIGKIGIPDSILNKPGKLTPSEWEIMKTHSLIGYNILKNSNRKILKAAAIVSKFHHEKWDGSGYPEGLKSEEIHIFGRITAVADVFDALGSDRCYKKAWHDKKIFKLFLDEKAKHFDPVLINLFFRNLDKFINIRNKYKD